MLRHKYVEHINRRLSWEKHPFAEDARHALKRMAKGCWQSSDPRPGGRYCDDSERDKQRSTEEQNVVRPGQNIEDVERGAMEHLMFGTHRQHNAQDQSAWPERRTRKAEAVHRTPFNMPIEQQDFFIDPITNRKVIKPETMTASAEDDADIPVKTFKDYRLQFSPAVDDMSESEQSAVQTRSNRSSPAQEYGTDHLRRFDSSVDSTKNSDSSALDDDNSSSKSFENHTDTVQNTTAGLEDVLRAIEEKFQNNHPQALGTELGTGTQAERQEGRNREAVTTQRLPENFDDLMPQHGQTTNLSVPESVVDEMVKRLADDAACGIEDRQPATDNLRPANEAPEKTYESCSDIAFSPDNKSDRKPLGFEEELVSPFLRHYQPSIDRMEPGDFPEPTVHSLRRKYGQEEVKLCTIVRDSEREAAQDEVLQASAENLETGQPELASQSPDSSRKESPGAAVHDEKSHYRDMLDSLMKQHARLSDAADEEASLAVKSSRAKNQQDDQPVRQLTGNYARDFPEEFEKSWSELLASAPAENTQASEHTTSSSVLEDMTGGLEGAYGEPESTRIQPALDRLTETRAAFKVHGETLEDAQSLSTAPPQEPLKDDHEQQQDKKLQSENDSQKGSSAFDQQSPATEKTPPEQYDGPTRYRILAYDPVMQKVNVAETTSLAPDFSCALSPADALLRLSEPLKFFPLFATLEEEGFEIISGGSDVLIFRQAQQSLHKKRRAGSTDAEAESAEHNPDAVESRVNPIDMTGRAKIMSPASANFASPTGYVNYENLPENEVSNLPPPPQRIKYNIDVRREEPVFSGPKYRIDDAQKPRKKGVFKRLLVGGVWVAGISYGLGVVSEYFTTGGVDGLGPKGF